ncbi:MAG TPA: TylF/MycF/NovP-related O-methyltransferase [Verrucomicrobiae bacterium]|nr:TylF/MycF/NovP-related O-methyltransferase [Verrucomicrobiae bacterium]
MTQSITGRFLGGAVRLADLLHLRWAITGLVHRLPPSTRLWLGKLQVRTGYMHGLTLVPEQELQRSFEAALRLMGPAVGGAGATYLEFGVFVGTSMACMYRATTRVGASGLRLVGFDSFQGMPAGVEEQDDKRWHEGQLYSDVELTRTNLKRLGVPLERIDLVPGWYEDSLTAETRQRIGLTQAAVVMVDCVLGASTRLALEFCAPLITDQTVIYFDDWAAAGVSDRGMGERAAFEEWLVVHPEMTAEELPALQYNDDVRAFLVTRTSAA